MSQLVGSGKRLERVRTFRQRACARLCFRRLPLAVLVAMLVVLGGPLAALAQNEAATPGGTPPPAPTDYDGPIDIGGRSLYLNCVGTGHPTVVFEAGGPGDDSTEWLPLQADVARFTRVCRYDRAGLGHSDPPPAGTRTIRDSVADLHALLSNAVVDCPCVLVGASFGGSIAWVEAGSHPEDLAGLVIVDGVPPGFIDRLIALAPQDDPALPALLGADNPEHIDQLASFHEVDATSVLPSRLPAVVIRHGKPFDILPPTWPIAKIDAAWREQQEAMARTLDARLVVAERSGHAIPFDQPDVVVEAARAVVEAVRDPGSWATPIASPAAA
jgi:pimeloyl-ACP methyl ester carboxylesterase